MHKELLNSINVGILYADNNHIIQYMDQMAIAHYEKSGGKKLIGRNLFDCHRKEAIEKIKEYHEQMLKGELERVKIRKMNQHDLYMVAIRDDDGKLMGYAEVFEKVSKKAEIIKENSKQKASKYLDKINQNKNNSETEFYIKQLIDSKTVLDINSETGASTLMLACEGKSVDFIDHREEMINQINRKIVSSLSDIKGSCNSYQVALEKYKTDKQYDSIILNNNVLNYVYTNKNKEKYLNEVLSILNNDGCVYISVDIKKDNLSVEYKQHRDIIDIENGKAVCYYEPIKYFEKQGILKYKVQYTIVENKVLVDIFEEIMRQSIISENEIMKILDDVGLAIIETKKIEERKETPFTRCIYQCKRK